MSDPEPEVPVEAPKEDAPAQPPAFGGFAFGAAPGGAAAAGTGFQFGSFAAASKPAEGEEESAEPGQEEECKAEYAPVVELDEVETVTGEEEEDILHEVKAKIFRFDDEWKERGLGQCKILQHKETKKCRLLMRRNKTLKICLNQAVQHGVDFQEHNGSDKTWVWSSMDFTDGELKEELLAIRFGTVEKAQAFKEAYVAEQNKLPAAEEGDEPAPKEDETEKLAETLEKAGVADDADPDEEA